MVSQTVSSFTSVTEISGPGNAYLVTWTYNTNTEITGFDINFSYQGDQPLGESMCEVLYVGYSSEEACQLFQPTGSPGYVPASSLVQIGGDEPGSPRSGEENSYLLCSPSGAFDLPPCPVEPINGCMQGGEEVMLSFTEKVFQFPMDDCEGLGGIVSLSPLVCEQPKLMDVFDFIVLCPAPGDLVVWGDGPGKTPTLLYSGSSEDFTSEAATSEDCEDVDCADPIFGISSCAPFEGIPLCGTSLNMVASSCCGVEAACDCNFPECMATGSCCSDACTMCNSDPNLACAAEVKSDPHFVGFNGQHFDFTGIAGHYYALLLDTLLSCTAQFAEAYTTGHFFDPNTLQAAPMRPSGTWMSQVHLQLMGSTSILVSTEDSLALQACKLEESKDPARPSSCFFGGSVIVDGLPVVMTGVMSVGQFVTVELLNRQSYGRVRVQAANFVGTIDYVPPPKIWEVAEGQQQQYAHLNLKVESALLSPHAKGILAETSRTTYDANGQPVTQGQDKDGQGVLQAPAAAYEVADLGSTTLLHTQDGR